MKRRRLLLPLAVALLAGCATKVGSDGLRHTTFQPKYLAKTEIDRVIDTVRDNVVDGLLKIADKLYRRNPRELRKGDWQTREQALAHLRERQAPTPEIGRWRETQAALYAFREDYQGDRVGALMYGLLTMVDEAFENRSEFFIIDDLNEQKLYNCARNLEIAIWKLSNARNAQGELLIFSNEGDGQVRNLSFEREFGRVIGLLDFLSQVVADKNGRSVTRMTQSLATAVFLPVGLLK